MSISIVDLPKKRTKYKPRYEKLPIRFVQRVCSVAFFIRIEFGFMRIS